MAISDAAWAAWLDDPTAKRVALYRLGVYSGGGETVRRLCSRPYSGGSTSTPYLNVIRKGLRLTETITIDSEGSVTAGAIEVSNVNGEFDSWRDDVFDARDVEVLAGDVTWPEADFRTVFLGTNQGMLASDDPTALVFPVVNPLLKLNYPVSEATVGTGPTPTAAASYCFGELFNISPPMTDLATQEFWPHRGAIEGLIEARVGGGPVATVVDASTGKVKVTPNISGEVTMSIWGDKPAGVYSNTISKIVQRLVKGFGPVANRYADANLDLTNLADFDAAHPDVVGIQVAGSETVYSACSRLAKSVGAQLVPSSLGKLRLIQFAIPAGSSNLIGPADMHEQTLKEVAVSTVAGVVRLGYCRNHTPQTSLIAALPLDQQALLKLEWPFVATSTASATAVSKYRLTSLPDQRDTCLQRADQALSEANRYRALVETPRRTYRFDAYPRLMKYELGQDVWLSSSGRYGLKAGKPGILSSRSIDFDLFRLTLEVTV